MKTLLLLIISSCLFLVNAEAQTVKEDYYYGNEYNRAVMGGRSKVRLDTVTSLPALIKQLEADWELVPTGKFYWIGYTDNMFSIAHYRDKAIEPLVAFIDTTHNMKAKKGALYTLHLIGINLTVVDRFSEDFLKKNARNALLNYLNDNQLNETVVYLIMRDPWLSDMPKLMGYLSQPGKDYSKVISALKRYEFKDRPFAQEITDSIFMKVMPIEHPKDKYMTPTYELVTFQKKLKPNFIVDEEITNSEIWQEGLKELTGKTMFTDPGNSVEYYFNSGLSFSYCMFDDSYNYIFRDHKIELYGPEKTREIWLAWWSKLSQSDKQTLFVTDHIDRR